MKTGLLIMLTFVLCSYSCEKLVDHTYFIRVHNETKDTIMVCVGYNYPAISLPSEKPKLVMVYPNTKNGGLESKTDWKTKAKNDTLSFFILSKDVVDTYNWKKIRDNNNFLKRYDLSFIDLDKSNWIVTYP